MRSEPPVPVRSYDHFSIKLAFLAFVSNDSVSLAEPVLTSVHDNCLACDKGGIVTRQEQDRTRYILRLSQPLDCLLFPGGAFCSSDWDAVANVFVRPGNTALAVMPSLATSFAKPRINPMVPIFVAM
jgi:hypothetical protein